MMKTKRIPSLPQNKLARCSFCKTPEATTQQVVGGQYGGRSVCKRCLKALKKQEHESLSESEGEAQLYHDYGVF